MTQTQDRLGGSHREQVYIGRQIAMLRERRSLTQKELGRLTGIAQANISRIEGGKVYPLNTTLRKIGDALGVKWQDFLP